MMVRSINQKKIIIDSYALLIALTIIGFEFVSFFAGGADQSRIVTIPYRFIYILLVFYVLFKKKSGVSLPFSFLPLLLFCVFYFIKSIIDLVLRYDLIGVYAIEFYVFCFILGFLPMAPMLLKVSSKTLTIARDYTLVLTIITNIWAFRNNYSPLREESFGRYLGNEILNQITYGQTGVILIILSITYIFKATRIKKLFFLSLILLGLVNIGLAASRGPIIELVVCLFIFFFAKRKEIGKKTIFIILSCITVLLVFYFDKLVFFNTIVDRFQNTDFGASGEKEERYYLLSDGFKSFLADPIFGGDLIGIYPHNLILESFMALGILGGFLMIIIMLIALVNSIRAIYINNTDWLGLILLMQIISSMVSGAIANSYLFWALAALLSNVNRKDGITD